jgi:hypothetical protein
VRLHTVQALDTRTGNEKALAQITDAVFWLEFDATT